MLTKGHVSVCMRAFATPVQSKAIHKGCLVLRCCLASSSSPDSYVKHCTENKRVRKVNLHPESLKFSWIRKEFCSVQCPTDSGATRTKMRERKVCKHTVGYVYFANRLLVGNRICGYQQLPANMRWLVIPVRMSAGSATSDPWLQPSGKSWYCAIGRLYLATNALFKVIVN